MTESTSPPPEEAFIQPVADQISQGVAQPQPNEAQVPSVPVPDSGGSKDLPKLSLVHRATIVFIILGFIVLAYIVVSLLQQVHLVASITAVATLLAYVLAPTVNYLHRRKGLNRILSISVVYAVLLLGVGGTVAIVYPHVKTQYESLSKAITSFASNAPLECSELASRIEKLTPPQLRPTLAPYLAQLSQESPSVAKLQAEIQERIPVLLGGTFSGVFTGVKAAAGVLTALVLVPLFTFYILMDSEVYYYGFLRMIPQRWKQDATSLMNDIDEVLGRYIRGQLIVCGTIGASIAVALNLVGLEYATLIGVFAGVVDIIPYLGVAIGMIPAFLVAWVNHGFLFAVFVVVVMEVVHWTEGHVIVPAVVGHSVGLPPLVVMIALGAGAELGGIFGMVFAIPVAAIIRVLCLFYIRKLEKSYSTLEQPAESWLEVPEQGMPVS
jgi:predicted PurR-regulated permease PerM